MKRTILVIEDDAEIGALLTLHLRRAGYEVDHATDGEAGLERLKQGRFGLVIIDIMLPGRIDGLEVCRRIRGGPGYTAVLMLTARGSETDRVVGLELGADDYVTKPFSIPELLARVKALFRRADLAGRQDGPENAQPIEAGYLRIDPARRAVSVGGRPVDLTPKEFDLLLHFARNPGLVFTRAALLDQIWGYGYHGYDHTVNSHINRLRSKIERDPANPRFILTVWGVGYRFGDAEHAKGE